MGPHSKSRAAGADTNSEHPSREVALRSRIWANVGRIGKVRRDGSGGRVRRVCFGRSLEVAQGVAHDRPEVGGAGVVRSFGRKRTLMRWDPDKT